MNVLLRGKTLTVSLGILLLFVIGACSAAGNEAEPAAGETSTSLPTEMPTIDPAILNGQRWTLIHTIVGGDAVVPVSEDILAYLQFDGDLVSGQSGCNNFSGTVTIEGNQLSFSPLAATQMACPESQMAFETEFLNLLSQVGKFALINGDLELQNSDGLPLARFAPTTLPAEESADLDGQWSLIHTIVGGDAVVPVPENIVAYLQFDGDAVSGQSGCNNFSGTVMIEGNQLSFSPLAATRMACPEPQMAFETEFLNLLSQVGKAALINGDLELQNSDGLPLVRFAPATMQTLFVGPEQVDCIGEAPQKCLLVKETAEAEYTYFYDQIVGFSWEAGYEYELLVRVVTIQEPPADASSLRYELVELVSQTAVEDSNAAPALGGTVWQWVRSEGTNENDIFTVTDPTRYTIEFLPDNSYQLHNDCNSGSGDYEQDGSSLLILPGLTTLAACGEESLDLVFNSKLGQVVSYAIEDGQLWLTLGEDGGNLIFIPAG